MADKKMNITAKDIVTLLRSKHNDDVFVSECKDGETWGSNGHRRLDGWVMKRSYTTPLTIGYEIKVSRQDFLNDNKFHEYLALCNEFYFVCPAGLIEKGEIPDGVGLIWTSKTGTRLYTKRKARYRDIEEPVSLFKYILMSRAEITPPNENNLLSRQDLFEDFLNKKESAKRIGRLFGKKLRKRIEEEFIKIDEENQLLKAQNNDLNDIKKIIKDMGVKLDTRWLKSSFERQFETLNEIIPENIERQIRWLAKELNKTVENIDEFKTSGDEK